MQTALLTFTAMSKGTMMMLKAIHMLDNRFLSLAGLGSVRNFLRNFLLEVMILAAAIVVS